jgi:hypothetical protein
MAKRSAGAGGGGGHTAKHASAAKHTRGKAKHAPAKQKPSHHKASAAKVHTVASSPKVTKKRGLAAADAVNCCAAEAVAQTLRLAGGSVSDADVLALYYRTAGGPDAGASIWETLDAAYRWGLAGVRPLGYAPVAEVVGDGAVILGVDLPGDHAVVADSGRWWSWGTAWPLSAFPRAVTWEAWEVQWPL